MCRSSFSGSQDPLGSHNQTSITPVQRTMSTDIVADALLGLATCDCSIKSLSRILTSLHSIDSLHRLKEKPDVVEAILSIASFAPFFAPPAVPAPSTAVEFDLSSIEARLGHLERVEMLRRDALAPISGERQDEMTSRTHIASASSQSTSGTSSLAMVPPKNFIHPERQSEGTPVATKGKPLYSFLLHFPVFSALSAKLSVADRRELSLLPAMAKWRLGNEMNTLVYPRLRLTNEGSTCVVVDDDLERLDGIWKDLEKLEKELWDKSAADILDRTFFLVGTWNEEHVVLAFSILYKILPQEGLGDFERWTTPGNMWKDLSNAYPLLSHHQELAHGKEGVKKLLGGRLFHRQQRSTIRRGPNFHTVTLIVPLPSSPPALTFANDFAAQSSISLWSNKTQYMVDVYVVRMGPPVLKEEGGWDGPVLCNDEWRDAIDDKFGPWHPRM